MTLREPGPGARTIAMGGSHSDAAALYGGTTKELLLLTYDEWNAGTHLTDVGAVRLAAYADMGPVLGFLCERLAAGQDLDVSVEHGVGPARAAVDEELSRHPTVRVTGVTRVGERVVLHLGTGVAAESAQRRILLDLLDRTPGPRPSLARQAQPDSAAASGPTAAATGPDRSVSALPVRLLRGVSGITGATTRRGRLLTLLGIAALLGSVLLLLLYLIGVSELGSVGVVVALLVLALTVQAAVGIVVVLQAQAVSAQRQDLDRVRNILERRTDRLLTQGRKAAQGQRDLRAVRRRMDDLHRAGLRERAQSASHFDALDRTQTRQHLDTQRQVQAMLNLEHLVNVSGRVPPMGGWAASADLMVLILDEVLALRPSTVVECGSGTSTLLLALAVQQHGLNTRVVALEHLERFGEQTEAALVRHGVADRAEVRIAPLTVGSVQGHATPWYAESALDDLQDIGVLVVDGPPTATGDLARFPAVPLLRDRLAPASVVIMDDLIRDSDRRVADLWRELLPDFSYEVVDTLQKRAGVFRRNSETVARSRSIPGE